MGRVSGRQRLAVLAALVTLLPASAEAQSKAVGPRRRPPSVVFPHPPFPRPFIQAPGVTPVETSTHELAVDRLPVASLPPAPLAGAPATLPPSPELRREPTALRLVDDPASGASGANQGGLVDPWRGAGPRPGATTTHSAHIEAVDRGVTEMGWERSSVSSATLAVGCEPKRTRSLSLRELHWRQLRRRDDGSFALREGRAWFDGTTCKLVDGSSSESPLSVTAAFDGQPLMLAAHAGDELVLVTPPLRDITQDGGSPKVQPFTSVAGLMTVTRVKPVRGGALSLSATVVQSVWQQWRGQLGDASAPASSLPAISVRFDLSQAVSEPAPLALLTVQRPVEAPVQHPMPATLSPMSKPRTRSTTGGLINPFE